jgi:hypothetical protein
MSVHDILDFFMQWARAAKVSQAPWYSPPPPPPLPPFLNWFQQQLNQLVENNDKYREN